MIHLLRVVTSAGILNMRRHRCCCCCCRCDSDEEEEICTEHGPPTAQKGCKQCLVDKFIEEAKRVGTVVEENESYYTIEITSSGMWKKEWVPIRITCNESGILGVTLREFSCYYEVVIDPEYRIIKFGKASYPGHKEWMVWYSGEFNLTEKSNYKDWDF